MDCVQLSLIEFDYQMFDRLHQGYTYQSMLGLMQLTCETVCTRESQPFGSTFGHSKLYRGAYGKAGIRNRKQSRKRNRNRKRNPTLNLRNKNWRRFCLESVTNNNCSIKTFHPHIIFIYCYYIFYCRIFCVRRKIFLREFHIRVSVASWDHD